MGCGARGKKVNIPAILLMHETKGAGPMTFTDDRVWTIYLSGEIHTDWREALAKGIKKAELGVDITSPVLDHDDSDKCGTEILGDEANKFWADHKGAKLNAIRNRTLIETADLVIVRFGDKYRQWNAAFDAGFAVANEKPLITLHDADLDHALKEIDAAAMATCRTVEQVVRILEYVIDGDLD